MLYCRQRLSKIQKASLKAFESTQHVFLRLFHSAAVLMFENGKLRENSPTQMEKLRIFQFKNLIFLFTSWLFSLV